VAHFTRREFLATPAVLAASRVLAGQLQVHERNLLTSAWPETRLKEVLAPRERFHPFPAASERAAWQGLVAYDGQVLHARVEAIPIEDAQLRRSWGGRLYRILLQADAPPLQAAWTLRITQ